LGVHLGASQINLHWQHCSSVVSSFQQAGRIQRQWPANAKLQLHAAYFAVGTGLLSVRDPLTGVFEPLAGAQH
jgi:hypothetical protein